MFERRGRCADCVTKRSDVAVTVLYREPKRLWDLGLERNPMRVILLLARKTPNSSQSRLSTARGWLRIIVETDPFTPQLRLSPSHLRYRTGPSLCHSHEPSFWDRPPCWSGVPPVHVQRQQRGYRSPRRMRISGRAGGSGSSQPTTFTAPSSHVATRAESFVAGRPRWRQRSNGRETNAAAHQGAPLCWSTAATSSREPRPPTSASAGQS